MKGLPKGVWFQKKRLADGSRVRYGYYGRGPGMVALGREGTPEFHERLADALRKQPEAGKLVNIIWQYKQSTAFAGLAPRTRQDYIRHLDAIQIKFGNLLFATVQSKAFLPHVYKWRDELAKPDPDNAKRSGSPKQANYAVTVFKLVLAWAVKRGIIDRNIVALVDLLPLGDRREKSWSQDQIDKFMKVAPASMQWAMILALETGQRQADLIKLPWSAVKDETTTLRQSKTNVVVSVPVSPLLRAWLDKIPRRAVTILTNEDGLPWEPKGNSFRAAWRYNCVKAGIEGLTFHDLRGTFVTNRIKEGWTLEEVAMSSGHSLRNLAMLDVYADREEAARVIANRINQRRNKDEAGTDSANRLQTATGKGDVNP